MSQGLSPFGGPHLPAFGGGLAETTMAPLVLGVVVIAVLLVFALPRKHASGPILAVMLLIPVGNQIYLGGGHWLAPRIIALCGLLRVAAMRSDVGQRGVSKRLNPIDWALLVYVMCQCVAVTVLNRLQPEAIINQIGFVVDYAVTYVVIRALVQDESDVYRVLNWLACIAAIVGLAMVREQFTGQNVFGVWLQGTAPVTAIRDGKLRSQGPFQHALTAGAFGASLLPLFLLLWHNGRSRVRAAVGVISSTAIAICANSSTPLFVYAAGLLAVALWPIRRRMRAVRWGLLAVVVVLHLVMKAPVWYLIARVDLTGSSSSYHRAVLVDQFIHHWADWFLVGTKDAANWGYDLWDAQNQYVSAGETGGFLGFLSFVAIISYAFGLIGKARTLSEGDAKESMCWLLGAALFANLVAFFGVNYFDQARVSWLLLLAMLSAAGRALPTGLAHEAPDGRNGRLRQLTLRDGSRRKPEAGAVAAAMIGPQPTPRSVNGFRSRRR